MSAAYRSVSPSRSTTTSVTAVPAGLVSSLTACAFRSSVTLSCLRAGRTPSTSASDLACSGQGKPSQESQCHADAVRQVRLVDQDAARRVERVVSALGQVVGQLLNPGLVGDRGVRVRRAGRRLGRILAPRSVHLVHRLGSGVVRLHVLIGDGPGRRQAIVVMDFTEVLLAHPVERGAVQLGRAADEVMHLRLEEGLALHVVPLVGRDVTAIDEDVFGRPVGRLAGQPVAPLEQQDALARRGEVAGERAAAGPRSDHDDVVVLAHAWLLPGGTTVGAGVPGAVPDGSPRRRRTGRRGFDELIPADPPAEDVVGPGLIGEDQRQEEEDDDGHRLERIRIGRRVVHGEAVGRVGTGHHHVGVQANEDRDDAGRRGDRGRGEGEAVAVRVDQPDRGQDGDDGEQLKRPEKEGAAGLHVRPDGEAHDRGGGERGHRAGDLPGAYVHVVGGFEAQERRAVQQADQHQGDPGEHGVGLEQIPE